MKVVITGARGFIGRNLALALLRDGSTVAGLDIDNPPSEWPEALRDAAVVFHLAGINRPDDDREFEPGNVGSLEALLGAVDASGSSPLVVLSSSTQADADNPYGRSKARAEHTLEAWSARTGGRAVIYRLPGVFGKWCRPNYNSVVATFCHNIARDLPVTLSDPSRAVDLVHVDDVVAVWRRHLTAASAPGVVRAGVHPVFRITLGDLASRLRAFREMRQSLLVPDLSDALTRRLFGTYTSYLPVDALAYGLDLRTDPRGALAELLKAPAFGQIFVSRTLPGITRGHHYHDLKVEKFCVLEGEAVVRFRSAEGGPVTEHRVSGREFKVVDIPPGLAHSIENIGDREMIVLFWACEIFDPHRPDTHPAEVPRG